MCVPSYSVCLKDPQQECVCCWHSPSNIVWIFHQDPKPCYERPLFSDMFVHSLCIYGSARVFAERRLLSLKLCKFSLALVQTLNTLLCYSILRYCPSWRSVDGTSSCRRPCRPLLRQLLCRTPWHSLECRSLQVTDKAWWKARFLCAWLKEVHG